MKHPKHSSTSVGLGFKPCSDSRPCSRSHATWWLVLPFGDDQLSSPNPRNHLFLWQCLFSQWGQVNLLGRRTCLDGMGPDKGEEHAECPLPQATSGGSSRTMGTLPTAAGQWAGTATALRSHLAFSNEAEDICILYIAIQVPSFILRRA